jgi:two-component system, sensor histidine kinase PdtaS
VASVAEFARERTRLSPPQVEHLQRLARSTSLLADLSFGDVLLYAATTEPGQFLVLNHVRSTTSQTLYRHDPVGELVEERHRPYVARAHAEGMIVEGVLRHHRLGDTQVLSVPVRHDGALIAVLARERAATYRPETSELERFYLDTFDRFARMVSRGEFPFSRDEEDHYKAPRVGDGLILVDVEARVQFASPNAVSALHRLGVHRNASGTSLDELTSADHAIRAAIGRRIPVIAEVERGPESTVVFRCIPLFEEGSSSGALVLVRDISELKRRDRLLLSKDATIREIHHRVKNNLQTISSLLRLQSRRLASEEAKAALLESVRRIAAIAVVHDTLAQGTEDDVPFHEIVRPLVRLVEESLVSPDRPIRFSVTGTTGVLLPEISTPLAVVITELLQNVVDHAYPHPSPRPGQVEVMLGEDDGAVLIEVRDDGGGLPPGFRLEEAAGLGLTIVRTFVEIDLGGTISMRARTGCSGTVVTLRVPVADPLPPLPGEQS